MSDHTHLLIPGTWLQHTAVCGLAWPRELWGNARGPLFTEHVPQVTCPECLAAVQCQVVLAKEVLAEVLAEERAERKLQAMTTALGREVFDEISVCGVPLLDIVRHELLHREAEARREPFPVFLDYTDPRLS